MAFNFRATGLKDKHKTEIREGDILKYAQYPFGKTIYITGIVENTNGLWVVGGKSLAGKKIKKHLHGLNENGIGVLGLNNTNDVEIIGNIYENKNTNKEV